MVLICTQLITTAPIKTMLSLQPPEGHSTAQPFAFQHEALHVHLRIAFKPAMRLKFAFSICILEGIQKKIMSKIRPTEMSFLYSEPRIFNFVVSITLSITFLLNQYLSDFTESDKMVEKNLRVPWPCIFIWFCFKSFMEITNSVFNYKRLFC